MLLVLHLGHRSSHKRGGQWGPCFFLDAKRVALNENFGVVLFFSPQQEEQKEHPPSSEPKLHNFEDDSPERNCVWVLHSVNFFKSSKLTLINHV